jgi:hypothetical protein
MNQSIAADPRKNAPPRISDLHGDARRHVLVTRDLASRERFMATYDAAKDAPCAKVGRWELIGTLAIVLLVATIFFGKAFS